MTVVAALATGLAVLLWRPPDTWWVRHRLGLGGSVAARPAATTGLVLLVATGGPVVVGLPGPRLVLALTVAGAAGFALRQARSSRARSAVRRRRAEVTDLLGLMAAELRAGILPAHVLAGLAPDFGFLGAATRSADIGGDVPAALRVAARTPGRELLGELAGAWHVAERAGAPLARVLDRLEESSRAEREIEREVESGVAPARATGRLMAVLPAVGLALGSGMGGDPLAVLTGTWPGVLCLAAGVALACTGVGWVERIADSVERAP
ncbi:MAG: type secretion system protein [Aeromicrobium sp.]|uniref:type II secretion system F family protein n=1 Tax=Aeromicrobium sp. TaxID=1871063 RepID=UPI00262F01BC|nr:type II secretion system F family protein [Aeromicrobium sp.]MCW2788869.1 type secretion system protein [Aeromicrobium sp.]MCW2824190.1 type secretion system protein [Aeromicrobium sp.]